MQLIIRNFHRENSSLYLLIVLLSTHLPNIYVSLFALIPFVLLQLFEFNNLPINKHFRTLFNIWLLLLLSSSIVGLFKISSINNIFWGLFTYAYWILVPITLSYHKHSFNSIHTAIKWFIRIELFTVLLQIINQMIINKTIFVTNNMDLGDHLGGTSWSFSSILATSMGIINLIYLCHSLPKPKRLLYYKEQLLLSFLLLFLTGYMAGIAIYFTCIAFFIIMSSIYFLITKMILIKSYLYFIISGFFALVFLFIMASKYFIYLNTLTDLIINSDHFVLKIELYINVIKYIISEFPNSLVGVGLGNGASRASFIVSGEYIRNNSIPILISPSEFYNQYLHPLMQQRNHFDYVAGVSTDSMANAPFSQYAAFITEFGIIGFTIWIGSYLYFGFHLVLNKQWLFLLPLLYIFSLQSIDNWAAYPSFIALYWLTYLCGTLKNSKENSNENSSCA